MSAVVVLSSALSGNRERMAIVPLPSIVKLETVVLGQSRIPSF